MAVRVSEIMNHELLSVGTGDAAGDVLALLLAYGISAAPVLDDARRPVGFVALRDLARAAGGSHVLSVMSAPADTVPMDATIADAAALMIARSRHHLVTVDGAGRAVGFIGTLDVLRGLLGQPVPHPSSFAHHDAQSGFAWTDEARLTFEHVDAAPASAGVFELVEAAAGQPNRVVWQEGTHDLRRRLRDMLTRPADAPPHLVAAVIGGQLWFRCAPIPRALADSASSTASG
jgi:CBS domain-containing protein